MSSASSTTTLAGEIRGQLTGRADPGRAVGQQAYMKSAMPFLGVPRPEVRRLVHRAATARHTTLDDLVATSMDLFDHATWREERYAAIDLTGLPAALGRWELAGLHEHQARTGAWWDYVDDIAHRVAALHDAHPGPAAGRVRTWARDDSLWIRRLAILSQLQRGPRTDTGLLAEVVLPNATDPEFFIRKAIGWALRDYARTDPAWVAAFVASHDLSPLSRREALKHLG
ncbi:MAG: DNA alkylation repair protein [Actinomycetia bacterium]|nr:DNA alkylation repair protein [Actinomycetes bacterium]